MRNLLSLGLTLAWGTHAQAASWDGKQPGEGMEKFQPGASSKNLSCFPHLALSNL